MKVSIEAENGEYYDIGYVALDTIMMLDEFTKCETKPKEASVGGSTTTPAPPVLHDCDFETDLCDWKKIGPDGFLFNRVQGSGQDDVSGPQSDHDGNAESMICHNKIMIFYVSFQLGLFLPMLRGRSQMLTQLWRSPTSL